MELVTCVDLEYKKKGDKPVYQFIYASELYGTMFAIYAKFEYSQVTLPDGPAVQIDKIDFQLVNYKGSFNIGFTGHRVQCEKAINTKTGEEFYNVFFIVRGASATFDTNLDYSRTEQDEAEKEKTEKIKIPGLYKDVMQVKKEKPLLVVFNRILIPLPDFQSYFDERDSSRPTSTPLDNMEPPVTTIFDTEFNDRDGSDFYNRELKPGFPGYEKNGHKINPGLPGLKFYAAAHRCNTSNVNLIFR